MPRPRVPMEKRELEGTVRAKHRKKASNAPKVPIVTVVECPGLTENAAKHWPMVRAVLGKMPVTAETDIISIQRLAEVYGEVRELGLIIQKEGHYYEAVTKEGFMLRPHPAVGAYNAAETRLKQYLIEFGLTPASRTKVKTHGDEGKDPLADLDL